MSKNVGEKIYWYTMKNAQFFVHEGEVALRPYSRAKCVHFNDGASHGLYPKETDIGVVLRGTSLWLENRDDELAKRIFIEHNEKCIAELEEQIRRKHENIKILKEEA